MLKFLKKFQYNAPVVLTFALLSLAALILSALTADAEAGPVMSWANINLFSIRRAPLTEPLFYFRLFGHVLGHAGIEHFMGNFLLILLIGPALEEKYGSRNMLLMILSTALLTGLVFVIFFPRVMLLGASGIVFMMILLGSFVRLERGRIPLTLVICAAAFIGREVTNGLFIDNGVASLAHIIGGVCGAVFGYFLNKERGAL